MDWYPFTFQGVQMKKESKKLILLLTGKKQSGKDTSATYLCSEYGYKSLAFADPLRDITRYTLRKLGANTNLDLTDEVVKRMNIHDSDGADLLFTRKGETGPMTYRQILQYMGTDAFRENIHEDIWVDMAVAKICSIFRKDKGCPGVLITDCRFPNEIDGLYKKLYEAGYNEEEHFVFKTLRVYRPDLDTSDEHISETALDNRTMHYTITNDSSLTDLYEALDDLQARLLRQMVGADPVPT
jgi:hypothetical protein